MNRIWIASLVLLLVVPASSTAAEKQTAELRLELEATSEALSAQLKLLSIYLDLGKAEDAATTRIRILELVSIQRKILDRLAVAAGGKPEVRIPLSGMSPRKPKTVRSKPIPAGATVKMGLDWLARHQGPDGLWDSDGFPDRCGLMECRGPGYALYDPGVTGLAALAFLGAGETHKSGDHKDVVGAALRYLKQIQDPEGCFGLRTTNHFVYNTAIATLAMVEAYGLTGSVLFAKSAQSGVDFLQMCRNPYLAWRYGVRPGDNDTSVTGWMTMALGSAKAAGLRVDPGAFEGVRAWLEKVTEPAYGRVGYTTRGTGSARPQDLMDRFPSDKSESLTAEGVVIRAFAGEDPQTSEMIAKGTNLIRKLPPSWNTEDGSIDMYYWYWGTLAMFRVGGEAWSGWNKALRKTVIGAQRTDGGARGSWDPIGVWGRDGGRVYSTALMTMVVEVSDRYAHVAGVKGPK